jgi:hypothetical protein
MRMSGEPVDRERRGENAGEEKEACPLITSIHWVKLL